MPSRSYVIAGLVVALLAFGNAHAQSMTTESPPLAFGMFPDQAEQALGVPLLHVRGNPRDELFVALPNVKGSVLSGRSDGLYLQFHKGRLQGWKGDWGTIRP
jgi:hypothetical protein